MPKRKYHESRLHERHCFHPRGNKVIRSAAHTIIATIGFVGLIGSALAADMTGSEITALISGKTGYLETSAASTSGKLAKARFIGTRTALPPTRRREGA